MQQVYRLIAQCAPTNATVLITGESGTGKELIARAIHTTACGTGKPFVAVDCPRCPRTCWRANSSATSRAPSPGAGPGKKGMFEMADGGTLFLDEIANIPLTTQAKLLRVIQEREIPRVGDIGARRRWTSA